VIDSELSSPQIYGKNKTPVKKNTYKRIDNCEDNDTLVIDNTGLLDVGRIQENMPEGRCIVDLSFMLKEIRNTYKNHKRGIDCQYDDWLLVNYCRRGLLTQLFYKCQMCIMKLAFGQNPLNPTN